jgi:hypothetical protein
MFRSQADACYPENGQQDGCFPDDAALPSRFMCWLIGQAASGEPNRGGQSPRGRAGGPRAVDPRAGRPRR